MRQVNLRMEERLKGQLEAAAKEHRTSMNSEILTRLEASFGPQAEDPRVAELFRALMEVMLLTGERTSQLLGGGTSWIVHAWGYNQVAQAAKHVLDAWQPTGDESPPQLDVLGDNIADGWLAMNRRFKASSGETAQADVPRRGDPVQGLDCNVVPGTADRLPLSKDPAK